MLTVLSLTFRQLTGIRRQALLWLFAASPVAVAVLIRNLADDYQTIVIALLDPLLVAIVLPLVIAILATTALGEDVEDRTLSYVMLRPVPRWKIVAAKYAAAVILGAVPLLLFGAAAAVLGLVDNLAEPSAYDYDTVIRPALGVAAGLGLGLLAYSAVFTWLGLVSGQALGVALVYVVVWEGVAAGIFAGIRYLSIRSYSLITMMEVGGAERLPLTQPPSDIPLYVALVGGGAVAVLFLGLTLRRLRNMDVP